MKDNENESEEMMSDQQSGGYEAAKRLFDQPPLLQLVQMVAAMQTASITQVKNNVQLSFEDEATADAFLQAWDELMVIRKQHED